MTLHDSNAATRTGPDLRPGRPRATVTLTFDRSRFAVVFAGGATLRADPGVPCAAVTAALGSLPDGPGAPLYGAPVHGVLRRWVPAAWPVVVVAAVDPSGWSPFGPAKWAAVSTVGAAAVGLVLGTRRPPAPLGDDRPPGGRWERAWGRAWVAFLVVAALAAATGEDPWHGFVGTPERRFGVLTWVLCALACWAGRSLDERGRRAVVGGAVVALLVAGAYATFEALWRAPVTVAGPDNRLGGPFGSAAYLGAAVALLLPVAVGVVWSPAAAWGRVRAVAALATLLGAVALVGSGTRGAWLGVGVAVVVLAVARRAWASAAGRRALAAGLAVSLAAGLVVTATGGGGTGVLDRPGGAGGSGRLDEWRLATRVVADHPLLGVGPEGYRTVVAAAMDEAYVAEHGTEVLPDRAHDVVLDIAATTGLAGLLAYLAVLGAVAPAVWRTLRRGAAWQAGIATGVVAYLAQQAVLFPLAELEPILWLLVGVVCAAAPAPRPEPAGAVRRAAAGGSARGRRVVAVACLAAAAVSVPLHALELRGDRAARTALAASARGDDRTALRAAARAAAARPDVVRFQLVAARVTATTGRPDDVRRALDLVDRALRWSPHDPFALAERALQTDRLARLTGDPVDAERAVSAARAVLARDPWNEQARAVVEGSGR